MINYMREQQPSWNDLLTSIENYRSNPLSEKQISRSESSESGESSESSESNESSDSSDSSDSSGSENDNAMNEE